MDYCFLNGFLVVLLIQHCTSKGPSTSIQSTTVVTLQDDQAFPQEAELPSAEVVPVVAPPSLQEVQQAVQEASEQVEGRGAEEVLKELLERVVEAALGQVEGGGEGKADETGERETLGAEKGETESDTEAVEEKAKATEMGGKGIDTDVEEEQEDRDGNAYIAKAEEGYVEAKVETAAQPVEETTTNEQTGGREEGEVEVIHESLDTKVIQKVVEETEVALEETGGNAAVEDTGVDDNQRKVEMSEETEVDEPNIQEGEETPADVEVAVGLESEQETGLESDISPVVKEREPGLIASSSDKYELETTQIVVGDPEEQDKEAEEIEAEEKQVHLVMEGGAAEEVEAEVTAMVETEGAERHRESDIKDESVALVNEGLGDLQAEEEEEQIALETSHEVLVISAPEPEDGSDGSIEQSPENQAPSTSTSLGGLDAGENAPGEKSNNDNEIITPTDNLLPHDPAVAQPTLDNFVKDVLPQQPQAIGEEPGKANELVKDTAGSTETSELGLEAWKIGAISAAVFLVLETVVILIYIVKCRDKNSTLAVQRACEEGCVEPEAATGGDCSDDTLLSGNGDTQQIAALDPSDVASALANNKEQHEGDQAIVMSDLPPSATEESANTGPGPDSSQDLRTSIL